MHNFEVSLMHQQSLDTSRSPEFLAAQMDGISHCNPDSRQQTLKLDEPLSITLKQSGPWPIPPQRQQTEMDSEDTQS